MPGQEPDNKNRQTPDQHMDLVSDHASGQTSEYTLNLPGEEPSVQAPSSSQGNDSTIATDDAVTATRVIRNSSPSEVASAGEKILERWQIIERLGEGGMATVYKAHHLILDKVVAIKFLHRHLCSNPSSLRRFQQEGQAASRLDHPNVIKVQDCAVTADGRVFLVMDYLKGKSLADLLKENGPLSAESALDLFIAISEGLKHAHSNGVLHRDLKPSNVMITDDNETKIVDFGIAKVVRDDGEPSLQNLTKTGEVFGSPSYMSPEQGLGQIVDGRSDIYSMGCLMYEVLTGRPPFQGKNSLDTIRMHIDGVYERIVPDSSKDSGLMRLDLVIATALEKDPDFRYQTVDELIEDLEMVRLAPGKVWADKRKELEQKRRTWRVPVPVGKILLFVVPLLWVCGFLAWLYKESPKGYIDVDSYQYSFWMVLPVKAADQKEMAAGIDDKMAKATRRALSKNDPVEIANTFSEGGKLEEQQGEWAKAQDAYSRALNAREKIEENNKMKSLEYIQDMEGLANCLAQEHKLSAASELYDRAANLYRYYREIEESKAQFHAKLLAEICKSQLGGHIKPHHSSLKTINETTALLNTAADDCTSLLDEDFEKHNLHSRQNLRITIQSEKADLSRRLILLDQHPDQSDFDQCHEEYLGVLKAWTSAQDLNAEGKCYFALALLDGKQNAYEAMAGNLYHALTTFKECEREGDSTSELSNKVLPAYLELCWKHFPWRLITHPPPR